jgi:hypothetical protein
MLAVGLALALGVSAEDPLLVTGVDDPDLVDAYLPDPVDAYQKKCDCDPLRHFSHFTTCKYMTQPTPHLAVIHTQHKGCHPLSPNYYACIQNNAAESAQSKCKYEQTLGSCEVT